jgi:hypothetical protein
VQVNAAVAAGGPRVRQRKAGGVGFGEKPETERLSLGFGRAV